MHTFTITRALGTILASLLLFAVVLPTSALGQPVIFADFERGGTDSPLGGSGFNGNVTSDLTGDADNVAEGDSAMVVTIDGDDTCSGGGCGFTGPFQAFDNQNIDPLDEDRMYLNMYMRTNASSQISFKLGVQDANFTTYIYQPFALDPGEYRLVSIPYSLFTGDVPTQVVESLFWELVSNPNEDFQIYIDHIIFTENPYQPEPDQFAIFDDFEGGIGSWSTTGGVSIGEGSDTPSNGGSTSLEITPSEGGTVGGVPNAIDVSGSQAPYLNMFVKRADSIGLEVTLADVDGDLFQLGFGNNGQGFYTTRTGSDFVIMSLPLSAFEVTGSSGDGVIGVVDSLSLQTINVEGSGPLIVDNISFTQSSALPVEIASFTGVTDGKDAVIRWQTVSESNNAGFALLHEVPGAQSAREVTFVEGAGTTTETQQYSHRIENLSVGTHRFRLRQVDFDGSTSYSDPLTLSIGAKETQLEIVGANPFHSSTRVQYTVQESGPVQLVLYDVLGRKVKTITDGPHSQGATRTHTIDGGDLSAGIYFLHLNTGQVTRTQRLTIVR